MAQLSLFAPGCWKSGQALVADAMVNSGEIEEMDLLRAAEYGMLAVLLGAAPTADVLRQIAGLKGDVSALGLAHIDLANAAAAIDETTAGREYFNLFIGVGRGELLPYGSYYQTGFLHERPLARVREDLALLGVERAGSMREPEDHVAILCEVMAGLARGEFGADLDAQARFFDRHLAPWAARFFADLETTQTATFYKSVGRLGRTFMELESEAFTLPR